MRLNHGVTFGGQWSDGRSGTRSIRHDLQIQNANLDLRINCNPMQFARFN